MMTDDVFEPDVNDPIILCDHCGHEFLAPPAYPSVQKSHLHSSNPPSPSGLQHITQLLARAEDDLQRYEDEIESLRGRIERLEWDRDQLKRYRYQYRYYVSPIRRVPVEIWTEIFYTCCEMEAAVEDLPRRPPFVLTARTLSLVCSNWRNIFRCTPKLWSFITVFLEMKEGSVAPTMHHIKMHLRFSEGASLRLRLAGPSSERYQIIGEMPVFDFLLTTCQRWQQLTVFMEHARPLAAFSSLKGQLPLLESLRIWFAADEGLGRWNMDPFSEAPRLRHLHLRGDRSSPSSNPNISSWGNILTVQLRNYDITHMKRVMKACRNAMKLSLTGRSHTDYSTSEPQTSNIVELSIALPIYSQEPKYVLRALTLPSLSSLCIQADGRRPVSFPGPDFLGIMSRSGCTLRKLSLENMQFKEDELLDVLQSTPDLKTLVLHALPAHRDALITDSLLHRLTDSPSSAESPVLVPHLTEIDITASKEKLALVMDMIESRYHPPPSLSTGGQHHKSIITTSLDYVALRSPLIRESGFLAILARGDDHSDSEDEEDEDEYKSHESSFLPRVEALRSAGLRISVL